MSSRATYSYTLVAALAGIVCGALIGLNLELLAGLGKMRRASGALSEVMALVETYYVDSVDMGRLAEETAPYMLSTLDPHSAYIPRAERAEADEELQGSFEGVGIEFNIFHDTLVIIAPLSGGPAERAGLQAGDKIIAISHKNVAGIGLVSQDVVRLLKGPQGSRVTVQALRNGRRKPLSFELVRDKVPQQSIDAFYLIDGWVGYIKLSRFAETTHAEFQQALKALKARGMQALALDLQGNPGGYMDQAISLVDDLLSEGQMIVYTKGKNEEYNERAVATGKGLFEQGMVFALIDESSGSASEIVAGALQDNDRATIVGRRSYGKGLVQSSFDLHDGAKLLLTVARYYTPSGRSIQKPYGANAAAYDEEIERRYTHGEFFHADSIHFSDSLRYLTVGGRAVYGGGGIMPDYFTPLDTILHDALRHSSAMQEYALQFVAAHKAALHRMGVGRFETEFAVTDAMIAVLKKMANKNDAEALAQGGVQRRGALEAELKAHIARSVWGRTEFYRMLNANNVALQKALQLMHQSREPSIQKPEGR